jgi:hypothetical protein
MIPKSADFSDKIMGKRSAQPGILYLLPAAPVAEGAGADERPRRKALYFTI